MNWRIIKIITTYFKVVRWIKSKVSEPITQFQLAYGIEVKKPRW